MKFKAHHTTDAIGRPHVVEEYIGDGYYERFKRLMLPSTNDHDLVIGTKKHGDITLGALWEKDHDYLIWLVSKSKQTKTIKYAAMRVIMGLPYTVPQDGEEYDDSKFFDHVIFKRYADQLDIPI